MNPNTRKLHDLGQSLWLDNISREMLGERHAGTLHHRAVGDRIDLQSDDLRKGHRRRDVLRPGDRANGGPGQVRRGLSSRWHCRTCAQAADMFRPVHDATGGVDGWVSLEVSPLLANDTAETHAGRGAVARAGARPNLFIKIPGTPAGIPAIEESIFAGVPINVTLLFSREQYLAAAQAYLRGIERRIAAGLDPKVESVASVFVSRWDIAVEGPGRAAVAQPAGHCDRDAHL